MSITSLSRARGGLAVAAAGALVASVLASQAPAQAAAPSNDSFASAAVISGTSLSLTASNAGATTETGEPSAMGYHWHLGASVWYRWTAPVTANYAVSTAGSDFDTELNVFTGSAVSALTRIATDDDAVFRGPDDGTSATGFAATAGTTYMIQVGGYTDVGGSAETGTVHLALGQAAISGTITYESDEVTDADPLSGCVTFFTDLDQPSGSVVGGGCGSGSHDTSAAYAVGLVPPGTYYVGAASYDHSYDYLGTDEDHALKVTIPGGGCTVTGLNVDLNTGVFSGPTGKTCPLAPACISAKATAGSATAALGSDKAALTKQKHVVKKLKKNIKKAKKHHKPTAKFHKKMTKAKKKVKKTTKTVRTATASLTTAQRSVTASC